MRPIDADALKDNMFHYAAPEMVWDRGDIEHKINEMPTIAAIPVEWLQHRRDIYLKAYNAGHESEIHTAAILNDTLMAWQKEQEAR